MRKKELREVVIIYCDHCKEEIEDNFRSIVYENGERLDLHQYPMNGEDKSCYEKVVEGNNDRAKG